jgi:hypothetical protein
VRELPLPLSGAEPAIEVAAQAGFAPELDLAAEAAPATHRFLRPAWYKHAGGPDPVTIVATERGGRVIAALPTAATRMPGLRAVPGSYWPFRGFPVAEHIRDEELAALLSARELGWAWRLGPANADDPILSRLLQTAPRAGWTVLRRRGRDQLPARYRRSAPRRPLAARIDAQEEPLSRKEAFRPDMKKARRPEPTRLLFSRVPSG